MQKRSLVIFMGVPWGRVRLPVHAEGKKEGQNTALGKRKAVHVVRIGRWRHFNGHWRFIVKGSAIRRAENLVVALSALES